jgi:phage regulator Rha-like protein
MKKHQQELKKLIERYYHYISPLEIDYFFRIIGDVILPYAVFEEDIWFPVTMISQTLGKDSRDYAANLIKNKRDLNLKGTHKQFLDKEQLSIISTDIKSRFPKSKFHVQYNGWFLNWERALDYIAKSSFAFTKSKKANPEITKVIIEDGVLFISSFEIAERLDIQHASLVKLIHKYEEKVEFFGLLIRKELASVKSYNNGSTIFNTGFYLLSEDQAYLIATLARNSDRAIDFKCWLVSQFARARTLKSEGDTSISNEEILHSQLAQLSLYSNLSIQSEFPLPLEVKRGSKTVKLIKRIDLFIDRKVAIELKNEVITPHTLNDIITSRGYLHSLALIPTFKYLIISCPQGVSTEAQKMLDLLHPKVIFKYPTELGDQIARRILKEYPIEAHWWLKKFIFPKFNKVLSTGFIQELTSNEP